MYLELKQFLMDCPYDEKRILYIDSSDNFVIVKKYQKGDHFYEKIPKGYSKMDSLANIARMIDSLSSYGEMDKGYLNDSNISSEDEYYDSDIYLHVKELAVDEVISKFHEWLD